MISVVNYDCTINVIGGSCYQLLKYRDWAITLEAGGDPAVCDQCGWGAPWESRKSRMHEAP